MQAIAEQTSPVTLRRLAWAALFAGSLGAALTERLFELECIARRDTTRSVAVTDRGRELFAELGLGV